MSLILFLFMVERNVLSVISPSEFVLTLPAVVSLHKQRSQRALLNLLPEMQYRQKLRAWFVYMSRNTTVFRRNCFAISCESDAGVAKNVHNINGAVSSSHVMDTEISIRVILRPLVLRTAAPTWLELSWRWYSLILDDCGTASLWRRALKPGTTFVMIQMLSVNTHTKGMQL